MKIEGLDKLSKDIKKLNKNYNASEILNNLFMSKNTCFNSYDAFMDAGGWDVPNFEDIPQDELDEHTRNNSKFPNFQEMVNQASFEFAKKKLNL